MQLVVRYGDKIWDKFPEPPENAPEGFQQQIQQQNQVQSIQEHQSLEKSRVKSSQVVVVEDMSLHRWFGNAWSISRLVRYLKPC